MTNTEEQETWIGVSDLMAGIAIVFIAFASYALNDRIIMINKRFCDILEEASKDLSASGISVGYCTAGRVNLVFDDQKTQFLPGKSELPLNLKKALDQAIPNALRAITKKELDGYIESFVVEGHTSDEWVDQNESNAYWLNMKLSQDRSRNVLNYIRGDIIKSTMREKGRFCHMRRVGSASGLSSRNPIVRDNRIDREKSRRIEIVILTQSEKTQETLENLLNNQNATDQLCNAEWNTGS